MNVASILDRGAANPRLSDSTAVSCGAERRTYGELALRAGRVAAKLAAAGLGRGDRVAVVLPNRIEWVEIYFALAMRGAVCVPVSMRLRGPEIEHICTDSGATWLVVDERTLPLLDEIPPGVERLVTVGEASTKARERLRYDDLVESGEPYAGPGPAAEDLAVIYYSSGTTGKPKGAAHSHANLLWNAFGQIVDMRLGPGDVCLVAPSLAWAAGFNNYFLALLWLGGRTAILPSESTGIEAMVEALRATGATHVGMVPTLVRDLLDRPDLIAAVRESDLRRIGSGGEPLLRAVIDRFQQELPGVQLAQGYGMSEFPTLAAILQPEDAAAHAGTAGKPGAHTQIAIRAADGRIGSRGEGEILVRSPATMVGYYGMPEETERVFADGWFATGDLGRIDDEGFLAITGRVKDMIISGGLNVYPREIEEVLAPMPGVLEACVVGVPDERWGEVPAAVIVATDGTGDAEAVISHCRERMASYKCPKHVLFSAKPLPRNPSGKILKREVRPWVQAELGAQA